ncbi:hypothetical protein VSS74_10315 [Conexibacter stalactiti]|uniref:DUF6916 domain-containing protein n=1 Tax=Conexibacter stalactiti TaxID=1940611 RepID=A0ABU4HN83_9ACTN|nr:hypothetical protein [Conexibacter stalactiti]MDW5594732.1 hypothetical protein [Conexibacter stalactiti]MEC5035374.1 hypothetical protein [Conexibacter stalactiti]
MSSDLEHLTLERCLPHVGEPFVVPATTPAGETVALSFRLDAATALGDGAPAADGRAPFALHFVGPADAPLAQGIVPLEHDALGRLEIFLVPVAREGDTLRYEAVFT